MAFRECPDKDPAVPLLRVYVKRKVEKVMRDSIATDYLDRRLPLGFPEGLTLIFPSFVSLCLFYSRLEP